MKIFLDPGHGGIAEGAVSESGLKESDVTLDICKRLGDILEDNGYDVKYSRTNNETVSLYERAMMANNWGADYFVSVHCNAADSENANGTETFFYPNSTKGGELALWIQDELVNKIELRDRGIKNANFAVLRLTKMPAVLVETAFISNPTEAELLADPDFRQKCAEGIAEGIINYLQISNG